MELSALPQFKLPLFSGHSVYLCVNKEEWEAAHLSLGVEAKMLDRKGTANSFQSLSGQDDVHLLGVFDGKTSTLAHEAAHIVFDICHLIGVDVQAGKANETFCYLLDHIMQFAEPYIKADRKGSACINFST